VRVYAWLTDTAGDEVGVNPEAVAYVRPGPGSNARLYFIGATETLTVQEPARDVVTVLGGDR
jgi:hypothetical protein